jgi:hypothetical protein
MNIFVDPPPEILYKDLGSSLYDQTSFSANILEADLAGSGNLGKEKEKRMRT